MILWNVRPAAMLMMATLPCPLLSRCVIKSHGRLATMSTMTTLSCYLYVVLWHGYRAVILNDDNLLFSLQEERDLVATTSHHDANGGFSMSDSWFVRHLAIRCLPRR